MDYEKKYKEALELMKDSIPDKNGLVHIRPCDIFSELKKSEDDIVIDALISGIKLFKERGWKGIGGLECDRILAWLEKQGEQKAICRNNDTTIDHELNHYCCKIYNALHKENGGKLSFARLQNMAMDIYQWCNEQKQGEQKPVEWSEEDNEHIHSILERLDGMCKKGATFTGNRFAISDDKDWLKSLKPQSHWKPSEEQLKALQGVYDWYMSHYPQNKEFESLFDDLLKL